VRDEFIDSNLARQIIVNDTRQLASSLDASESGPSPHTTSDKLERSGLYFLAGGSDTDDDTLTPSLMAGFKGRTHDAYIASAVKGIVEATVGEVDQVLLDRFIDLGGIDKIGRTEFPGPFFLPVVGVYRDNPGGAAGDTALDYTETDTAGTEDRGGSAFLNLGGLGRGTVTGGNTTSEETGFLERCGGVDSDNGDIGDD
jgi:hypothetical protein